MEKNFFMPGAFYFYIQFILKEKNVKRQIRAFCAGLSTLALMGMGNASAAVLLNEIGINPPGNDDHMEFIELLTTPGIPLDGYTFLALDGSKNPGKVIYARSLDGFQAGANGLVLLHHPDAYTDRHPDTTSIPAPEFRVMKDGKAEKNGLFPHDAITFMVLHQAEGISTGMDLDPDDQGVLSLGNARITDSVGWQDKGGGKVYSPAILTQSSSNPDFATRFLGKNGVSEANAWCNGDLIDMGDNTERRYDPAKASANLPPNARITPGRENFVEAPFVLLNEMLVTPPSGSGLQPWVELTGNPMTAVSDLHLLAVSGKAANAGEILQVLSLGSFTLGGNGLALIQAQGAEMPEVPPATTVLSRMPESGFFSPESLSVLLVYSQTPPTIGTKLDMDATGAISGLPHGASVLDAAGWTGSTGDRFFGGADMGIQGRAPDGASRFRSARQSMDGSVWAWGFLTGEGAYDANQASASMVARARMTAGDINFAPNTAVLVRPVLETAVPESGGSDADDPAFWVHPEDPEKSLVICTQKKAGYSIYTVKGETLVDVNPGNVRYNNVDVAYAMGVGQEILDIAVFSDRAGDKLAIYAISESAPYLRNITDPGAEVIFGGEPSEDTPYGLALYKSPASGKFYAFVTQAATWKIRQLELIPTTSGTVTWKAVRDIDLTGGKNDEQAEGLTVDQEAGILYICQEEVGVFKIGAEPDDATLPLTPVALGGKNGHLVPDIEGIALYYGASGQGYLLVSSQGSNSFAVYERKGDNAFIGSFVVVDNGRGIDGSEECDGMEVVNVPMGERFPKGLLVIQDGRNTNPDGTFSNPNFKFIPWESIAEGMGLVVDTKSYHPNPRAVKNDAGDDIKPDTENSSCFIQSLF
jgi:myo-inositol-hexaphosphate 3-phosphohydrolase